MSHYWKLRAAAVMWLRYDRGCPVVAMERGLQCVPDVMGVTANRFLIEIEIKRTMADFRRNAKKWVIQRRAKEVGKHYWIPKYFYFLVLPEMVAKVLAEIPESDSVGVMSFPYNFAHSTMEKLPAVKIEPEPSKAYAGIPGLVVHRKCVADPRAAKLPIRHAVAMARHMAGTFSSLLCTLSNHIDRDLERRQSRTAVQ